jgi:sugar lactone lactonase YvrE
MARYHHRLPIRITATPFFSPTNEELRYLPEGPRVLTNYPPSRHALGWVAIQHSATQLYGSLNILDLSTRENQSFPLPGRPGFFAETTQPGVVLIGLERRLVYFNILTGGLKETDLTVPNSDERVIINDGLAVDGGVFFGTKHLEFNQQIAGLYYYDAAHHHIHTLRTDQMCSNGKFLTRDQNGETILIDIDSIPRTISRYTLNAARTQILHTSLITPPTSLPSIPDGLRPTPDGKSIIVAFFNPEPVSDGLAQQIRLADGAVECEWVIPGSPRVTCPEFVQINHKVKLLFTTAIEGMTPAIRALAPHAGKLFIADTNFETVPSPPPHLQVL